MGPLNSSFICKLDFWLNHAHVPFSMLVLRTLNLPFLITGYVKYVVRLRKMFRMLLITDLWKSGMRVDSSTVVIPRPAGVVDAGADSPSVTS